MSLAANREKSARMAKYLVEKGFPHGKRQTSPFPDSGGTTMTWGTGSSKYKRLMKGRYDAR